MKPEKSCYGRIVSVNSERVLMVLLFSRLTMRRLEDISGVGRHCCADMFKRQGRLHVLAVRSLSRLAAVPVSYLSPELEPTGKLENRRDGLDAMLKVMVPEVAP